jgi:hypothetical protein
MSRLARTGQVLLALISAMSMLIAVSVNFVEDPFPHDARVLISSFGVGMGLLALVNSVLGLRSGSTSAWLSLWVLPVFFAWHVVALGTYLPDGVLLVVSLLALVATRPRVGKDARVDSDFAAARVPSDTR